MTPTPMVSVTRKQPPPPADLVEITLDLETARELAQLIDRAPFTTTTALFTLAGKLAAATAR